MINMNTETPYKGTRDNAWIETYTGRKFNIFKPDIEQINIEDIAHALSMCTRFNGHLKEYYSVAHHSVIMSRLLSPEDALAGLLHDASEAYLSDIPRPIKYMLKEIKTIENNVMDYVFQKYNVNYYNPIIKIVDRQLCLTEAHLFGMNVDDWEFEGPDKISLINQVQRIPYTDWKIDKQSFLHRFDKLTKGRYSDEYKL